MPLRLGDVPVERPLGSDPLTMSVTAITSEAAANATDGQWSATSGMPDDKLPEWPRDGARTVLGGGEGGLMPRVARPACAYRPPRAQPSPPPTPRPTPFFGRPPTTSAGKLLLEFSHPVNLALLQQQLTLAPAGLTAAAFNLTISVAPCQSRAPWSDLPVGGVGWMPCSAGA